MSWEAAPKQRSTADSAGLHSVWQMHLSDLSFLIHKVMCASKQPLQNNMALHSSLSKLISCFFPHFLFYITSKSNFLVSVQHWHVLNPMLFLSGYLSHLKF